MKVNVNSNRLSPRLQEILRDHTFPTKMQTAHNYPVHFAVNGNVWLVFKSHVPANVRKIITEKVIKQMSPKEDVYL